MEFHDCLEARSIDVFKPAMDLLWLQQLRRAPSFLIHLPSYYAPWRHANVHHPPSSIQRHKEAGPLAGTPPMSTNGEPLVWLSFTRQNPDLYLDKLHSAEFRSFHIGIDHLGSIYFVAPATNPAPYRAAEHAPFSLLCLGLQAACSSANRRSCSSACCSKRSCSSKGRPITFLICLGVSGCSRR